MEKATDKNPMEKSKMKQERGVDIDQFDKDKYEKKGAKSTLGNLMNALEAEGASRKDIEALHSAIARVNRAGVSSRTLKSFLTSTNAYGVEETSMRPSLNRKANFAGGKGARSANRHMSEADLRERKQRAKRKKSLTTELPENRDKKKGE